MSNIYFSLEMPVPSQGHYVFTVFRLLTDFVCLYTYEFWLSLCKIFWSSVILLLPLFRVFLILLLSQKFYRLDIRGHFLLSLPSFHATTYWWSLYWFEQLVQWWIQRGCTPSPLRGRRRKKKRGTIRTHWYADDLLKQCPSKGGKYAIDEELQHIDHLFLGVACFTFLNFVWKICGIVA